MFRTSHLREDLELIAVVMGCQTSQERFAACKSMLDYGFANFALVTAETEQKLEVPVTLGKGAFVAAEPGENPQFLIDKAQRGSVTTEVTLEESVTAPVSRGQRLGKLTVKAGEQILAQVPLIAKDAVERLTFGDLFVKIFRRLAMAG